jgi:hypothetical protein
LISLEYAVTCPKCWCKNNNCWVGIMCPLYLWDPMLCIPLFCVSYSHALFRLLWIIPTPNAVDISWHQVAGHKTSYCCFVKND